MENLQTFILIIHILACLVLILLVLLQAGKEGMGVIFGGGSSSLFGSSGAGGMLAKLTAFMATLFLITSLTYSFLTKAPAGQESEVINFQEQLDDVETPVLDVSPAGEEESAVETPETIADAPDQPVSEVVEPEVADVVSDTPDVPAAEETN